jgi:hypothetical protein
MLHLVLFQASFRSVPGITPFCSRHDPVLFQASPRSVPGINPFCSRHHPALFQASPCSVPGIIWFSRSFCAVPGIDQCYSLVVALEIISYWSGMVYSVFSCISLGYSMHRILLLRLFYMSFGAPSEILLYCLVLVQPFGVLLGIVLWCYWHCFMLFQIHV